MAGEKRFRTSILGGFNKADVNAYIERILREFEERFREKDKEISTLKDQYKQLSSRYEALAVKEKEIEAERDKIASAIINARETADKIIENARVQAIEEKKSIEGIVEQEKEKLVDIRENLKHLKAEVLNVLKNYDAEIGKIIEKTEDSDIIEESSRKEAAAAESEFVD
ncbi:MAG TPA: hypothetical protein GXX49_02505 [Clostridiaceae bacterium]|nr:hypothetical protein [Clostridiaceae bacterium]